MSGFYLKKFELFNWGTFDWKVESFFLNDDINIISGANWSWKSTIVDALVSLFVPNNKRKYNLSASETWKKKSRNEETYVRWAYTFKNTQDWAKTIFLRWNKKDESTYSVILAYFKEQKSWESLSLATFFRTTYNGKIEKFYVVARQELFIQNDFIDRLNNSWVKSLKNYLNTFESLKIFNNFREYSIEFSKIFSLKENAISLFNKVVSLKEIKDLNSFFRENMLDYNEEIDKEFEQTEKNYLWVRDIYDKIIEAQKKIDYLEPFIEKKKQYEKLLKAKESIVFLLENLDNYISSIKKNLLEKNIEENENILEKVNLDYKNLWEKIENLEEEEKSIEKLIENNDITKRVKEIENAVKLLEKDLFVKKGNYENFGNLCRGINSKDVVNNSKNIANNSRDVAMLHLYSDDDFKNQKQKIEELKKENQEKIKNLEEKIFIKRSKKQDLEKDLEEKKKEFNFLKKRENLLPKELSDIRKNICENLWLKEENLPFVCEYIKVADKSWEMPIEKLLHNFWKQMLVPEKLIKQVNDFINSTNLKKILKYNKIKSWFKAEKLWDIFEKKEVDDVFSKIEVKNIPLSQPFPQGEKGVFEYFQDFRNFIIHRIKNNFDYICLENTKDKNYYHFNKILTKSGLIKNKNSYIKDDRKFWLANYILGWDNKEKLDFLEKEINSLEEKNSKVKSELLKLDLEKKDLEKQKIIFVKLDEIKYFSQINYFDLEKEILEKNNEIKKLNNSNTKIREYKQNLEEIKEKKNKLISEKNKLLQEIWILKNDIEKNKNILEKINKKLENIKIEEIKEKFGSKDVVLLHLYSNDEQNKINLENIWEIKNNYFKKLQNKKEKQEKEIAKIRESMVGTSVKYKTTMLDDAILADLWNIETEELFTFLEQEYHKVKTEELFKYKKDFEKEFQHTLFIKLQDFYRSLENEADIIKNKIAKINEFLKEIKYSKNTYIQIILKDNNNKADYIADFKREMNEKVKTKSIFTIDKQEKIKVFEDLRDFMENIINPENEKWKNNVIDVRNWFLFSIQENYIDDDSEKEVYESSSWKSGWQTIKLAYSVLASALLYQYWINSWENSSFRLVVIDEVFAKLDLENSTYVLELFKKLWLQLFIITPTNTLNVLEWYAKNIYFISNPNWDYSFKEKIDIISRKKIEEKSSSRDLYEEKLKQEEREYLRKQELKKKELEKLRSLF